MKILKLPIIFKTLKHKQSINREKRKIIGKERNRKRLLGYRRSPNKGQNEDRHRNEDRYRYSKICLTYLLISVIIIENILEMGYFYAINKGIKGRYGCARDYDSQGRRDVRCYQ